MKESIKREDEAEHRIKIEKLVPGMMFARDVYTKSGVLVISRFEVITQNDIDRLVRFLNSDMIIDSVYVHMPSRKKREKKPKKTGKWNKSKIMSNNGNIEHWLNGKKILEYNRFSGDFAEKVKASKFKNVENFGIHKKGHILLQDHNHEVYFRNLKIKVL